MHIVLLDIDGTLIDPRGCGRRALHAAFAAVHGRSDPDVPISFAGQTDRYLFAEIAERLGVPLDAPALHAAYLRALADELPRGPARALPGALALCAHLARRPDVALGLQTGNLRAAADMKLAFCGLDGWFDFGGFGEDGPDRADMLRAAIARAPAGGPVAVLGDSTNDIRAAREVGARAVGVGTGFQPAGDLVRAGADALLDDLADLPACLSALGLA